jgi:hypothetical protein
MLIKTLFKTCLSITTALIVTQPVLGFSQTSSVANPVMATGLSAGTAYGRAIVPGASGQLVNASAVNWTSSSSSPSTAPNDLGVFSTPQTDQGVLRSAQSIGLTNMGVQAQINCQNYVKGAPGTTTASDLQCAAVNFLNNKCTTATPAEASVMKSTGATSAQSDNCVGTYGGGQSQFNIQVATTDPLFGNVSPSTLAANDGSSCSTVNVITTPAEFSQNTCVINSSGTAYTCSESLTTTITSQLSAATRTDTCSSGVLVEGYCQVTTSSPPSPDYVCAVGFTLSGTSCSETLTQAATPIYACPGGEVLSGSSCISTTLASIANFTCPTGFSVIGSNCVETLTQSASIASYSCPSGFALAGSVCTQTQTLVATPNYSCPSGYSLSGNSCSQVISQVATANYTCPTGSVLSGSNCTTVSFLTSPATLVSYSCPTGFSVSGASCVQTLTQSASIANYSCPSNYLVSGSNCTQTLNQPGTPAYACTTGYTLSRTSCSKTNTQSATPNYSCPSGAVLLGSICQTTTTASISSYVCPSAYTLSGTTCSETLSQAATASYSCPTGATLTGSGATSTCNTVTTSSATPTYRCPTGQALSGTQCVYLVGPANLLKPA